MLARQRSSAEHPLVASSIASAANNSVRKRAIVGEILNSSLSQRQRNSAYSEQLMSSSPGTVLDVVQTVRVHKRVRFQNGGFATELISSDLKPASEMSDDEKSLIWWRDCDYYVFKKRSKMIAKELLSLERAESTSASYCSLILRTYSVCCQTAEESHDDCTLSDQDRRRLELLSEKEHCRRGLERWRFPDLAMERSRRQSLAIRGVIDVQDHFVKCMNLDFDTGADFMRKSSEQLTRPARLFALLLGEADTIAAEHVSRGVTGDSRDECTTNTAIRKVRE